MLARFRPDGFTLAMVAMVTIALVAPCYGAGAQVFEGLTSAAIGLLFFLQGVGCRARHRRCARTGGCTW